MQRVAQRFRSMAEADAAEAAYYASLTPEERVDVLLDLIAAAQQETGDEAPPRLARVCRVVELAGS